MSLEVDFDLNEVGNGLIKPGDYRAVMTSVELKEGRKQGSKYLNCRFQLLDGAEKNASVYSMITTHNANQRAETIGRQQVVKLRDACGLDNLSDFTQLLNIPVGIRIKIEEARDGYDAQNRVSGYMPASQVVVASDSGSADGGPGF